MRNGILSAEKVTGQDYQPPDQWRVAVAAEPRSFRVDGTYDPYLGLTPDHAIGFDALGFREGGPPAGAVDDGSQAFLQILNDREVLEKRLLMGGEWHGRRLCPGWSGIKRALSIPPKVWVEDDRTHALKAYAAVMTDNVLIPLPGFFLPGDFPWRVKFVAAVEYQLRCLNASGSFLPPRFFGYYFLKEEPIGVTGQWTVSLDASPPLNTMVEVLEQMTLGQYAIASTHPTSSPDFLLVHDRLDGSCWLWRFAFGLRFVESTQPVLVRPSFPENLTGDEEF